jgi:Fe-S-cluster containining protein
MTGAGLPANDSKLVQIVDAAFADAARRSGEWLVCRPGCTQCCHGIFEITLVDALRLQRGLAELERNDPERAGRIRQRTQAAIDRLSPEFPGDPVTGLLNEDDEAFETFADDEPCPALDPETGRCDLYAARPITCRVFGPPVRSDGGLGVCELCYHGATDEQIAGCEMIPDPDDLESQMLNEIEDETGADGYTIVTFALAGKPKIEGP